MSKILKGKCKSCDQILISEKGGHFVMCECQKSFIDRDRWFPDTRYRFGGEAEIISFE